MGSDIEGAHTKYQQLTPVSLRSAYATLTDTLIHRIEQEIHGASPTRAEVVFLDKSARPVAWLVRSLWQVFARQHGTAFSEGCVPRMPGMHFANIDREQWWSATGASETGAVNVDRVPLETIAGLRGAFLRDRPPALDQVWGMPSFLDDARILVVDEVSNTGDTLAIASGLISRAFPTSQVVATHWMSPGSVVDSRSGQSRTASVPVWYRSDTEQGRLVGNRLRPGRGTSWRGDVGHLFLSTVPIDQDLRGVQLRREAGSIAQDILRGKLLARPAIARDDAAERIKALYGFDSPRDFAEARLAQDSDGPT